MQHNHATPQTNKPKTISPVIGIGLKIKTMPNATPAIEYNTLKNAASFPSPPIA